VLLLVLGPIGPDSTNVAQMTLHHRFRSGGISIEDRVQQFEVLDR
jgi:hypothetical protein